MPVPIPCRAKLSVVLAAALLAAGLAACDDNVSRMAAADAQVCYRLPTGDPAKPVLLQPGDPNLETCAMHVEAFRLMHAQDAVTGLYEGHMIFASTSGITSAAGPRAIRYRVYTPGQQADIDQKVRFLLARQQTDGNAAGDNAVGGT